MPFDRTATLRNAEKLLRQGKLDQAIAEYLRVVEEQPRDWNTANLLGDLYVRAKQVDKAVDQFVRIADSLSDEGFLPKAGALYKKILKLKPDDEHALLQAAEIASSQGLLADARSYLNAVAERRRQRGDQRGTAQIIVRLAALDPEDLPARLAGAKARVDLKDVPGAIRDFKELSTELTEKGRPAEAMQALREAAVLSPDDPDIRERLLGIYLAAGDYARARECAVSGEQLKDIAARLESAGQADEAIATLREAARLDPADAQLRATLARTFVARGDLAAAGEYLTVETAGDDPQLRLMVAEIQLRDGRVDEGLAVLQQLLSEDAARRQDIAMMGWALAEQLPDIGFQVVEKSAAAAVLEEDWPSAAATLQEFVTRVPSHIPALMRLVEICVDGGLEATMYTAQAQLADAYIAGGAAAEARFIAEDLVAREPWDRANIERFRRALELTGEPDPDGIIAERLSGQSPFTSTDLSFNSDEIPEFQGAASLDLEEVVPDASAEHLSTPAIEPEPSRSEPRAAEPTPAAPQEPPAMTPIAASSPGLETPTAPPAPAARKAPTRSKDAHHFELSSNAIDLESILGDLESPKPPPTAYSRTESVEVDLSIVLDDIKPAEKLGAAAPADLDSVFSQLRDDASRKVAMEVADEQYRRGVALHKAGKIDEAIPALQTASRAPRLRFAAASLLGRIHRDRTMIPQAIECFERAAQAPPSTPDEGHQLLYDLADALESTGEVARALAIYMELQADAGDYQDVAARIDRLAKAQARG